jgi:HPt (histidine-containing phosphotransfer) domain-containing protein
MDTIPTRTASANAPVDTNDLLNRCLGRMDIVERIIGRFQGVLDDELDQLERAVKSSNTDEIVQIAHRLKGASLAVSAYDLSDNAARIEKSAATSQFDEIQAQIELLKESRTSFRAVFPLVAKDSTSCPQSEKCAEENLSCES